MQRGKNCHLQKEVELGETEAQDKVQEVDSRDEVIRYRKERIRDFQGGADWCTWWSSKILP